MLNVIIEDFKKKSIKKIKDNRRKDFKDKMKINKHPKFKIMIKDGKEMLLFFKSTKIRKDEVSDQLVRDFENKNNDVDLNNSNCREDFEQRIIEIDINNRKSIMY